MFIKTTNSIIAGKKIKIEIEKGKDRKKNKGRRNSNKEMQKYGLKRNQFQRKRNLKTLMEILLLWLTIRVELGRVGSILSLG